MTRSRGIPDFTANNVQNRDERYGWVYDSLYLVGQCNLSSSWKLTIFKYQINFKLSEVSLSYGNFISR